ICTNESGILPASLHALHRRLTRAPRAEETLRLAGCGWLYDAAAGWSPVPGALPRVRLAAALDLADAPEEPAIAGVSADARAARVLAESPQALEVETQAERDTLLILADCHYPGWRAEVDGAAAEVLPVHGAIFRGVRVPAGVHRVRIWYRSAAFEYG